jgi:multiple sugar transport system permease protein
MTTGITSGPSTPARVDPPAHRPERRRRRGAGQSLFAYALLSPAFLATLAFLAFPIALLAIFAFKSVQLGSINRVLQAAWTTANMKGVLTDPETWRSLVVSLKYVAGSTLAAFIIGLGTALLLNRKFAGQRVFRTLILVPWAVPGVTATVAFVWLASPSFGVLNYLLRTVGLIHSDINWFGNPSTALLAVIAPTVWKSYPFFTIVLLAALQSIPTELYEAAAVDGAGKWHQFRWVTWPSVRRYAVIALAFNAMYVFREFDFIFASTQGGPAGATDTIAIRIYNTAFQAFHLASASALGLLTFVLVAVLVLFLLRSQLPATKQRRRP